MFISDIQRTSIQTTIGNLFRVQEGEWTKLLMLWLISFLIITANFLVWSVLQSTGIKRVGIEHLPHFYLASSVATLFGSLMYAKIITQYKKTTTMHIFNAFGIAFILLSWIFFSKAEELHLHAGIAHSHSTNFDIGYYFFGLVGNSTFLSFLAAQLWEIINELYSSSQAKRVFPLLGISGTMGGIVAGGALTLLTPIIGVSSILLFAIILMASITPLLFAFQNMHRKELNIYTAGGKNSQAKKDGFLDVFRYALKSKFVLALAGVVILFSFFSRLFGFVFAEITNQTFPTEAQLTQFSGMYLLIGSVASIIFDMVFLNRILERIGLTRGMFFASNAITALALSIFAFPVFAVIVGGVLIKDILLGIENSSMMVMSGVVPDEHRPKVSSFLDGTVVTLGGGIGSLLILLVTELLPYGISSENKIRIFLGIILFFLAARFFLNFYLRREFFRILDHNLTHGDLRTKKRAIETLVELKYFKREGIEKLIDTLNDRNEPVSIKVEVIRVLGKIIDPATMWAIVRQLRSKEPALRLAAAQALAEFHFDAKAFYIVAFSHHRAVQELRSLFKRDQNEAIRAAALDALIHLEDSDVVPFLLELLRSGDHTTRADCVHSLRLFHDPAIVDDVRRILIDQDPLMRSHAIVALWQFSFERKELEPYIYSMIPANTPEEYAQLTEIDRENLRVGIKTIGEVHFDELLPLLKNGLTWANAPIIQAECALSLFKMGIPEGKQFLQNLLEQGDLTETARIHKILNKRILNPRIASILQELIEQTQLQYPINAPSSENLDRPLAAIPFLCLKAMEEFYLEAGDSGERKKIRKFLERKEQIQKTKNTVFIIEPDETLRRVYAIGLLAHGYLVRFVDKLPEPISVPPGAVIVYDNNDTDIPEREKFDSDLFDKTVFIIGRKHGEEKETLKFEPGEGAVLRYHLAPSELIFEIEKKLRR